MIDSHLENMCNNIKNGQFPPLRYLKSGFESPNQSESPQTAQKCQKDMTKIDTKIGELMKLRGSQAALSPIRVLNRIIRSG